MKKRMGAREKRKLGFRDLRAAQDGRFFGEQGHGTGINSSTKTYDGPREFVVGVKLGRRGKSTVHFRVVRDEHLYPPYGGFRVSYDGVEIGRSVSWPTLTDCRTLKRNHRRNHGKEE